MSDRPRVLIREPIAEAGIQFLQERFDVDVDGATPLEERIGEYDAIVIRSGTQLTAELIERAERLKVIGRAGVGVDNVDVEAATRRGIVVANAPESTVVSAAEHSIGLLVALARHIPQAHAALKEGRWERSAHGGIELEGKTLGVLGFGRIGQQVARRAIGLGMRVVAYDPFVSKERFRELGAERVETAEEVLSAAEFLTLHLAADAGDAAVLDAEAIAADAGRRPASSTPPAASWSTRTRCSRRFDPASSPARRWTSSLPSPTRARCSSSTNVVVTPHLAASTEEAQDRAGVIVAEQVAAALEGELVTNAVNIPAIRARGPRGARPVRSARRQARAAGDGARRRARRPDRADLLREPLRVRHPPADCRPR